MAPHLNFYCGNYFLYPYFVPSTSHCPPWSIRQRSFSIFASVCTSLLDCCFYCYSYLPLPYSEVLLVPSTYTPSVSFYFLLMDSLAVPLECRISPVQYVLLESILFTRMCAYYCAFFQLFPPSLAFHPYHSHYAIFVELSNLRMVVKSISAFPPVRGSSTFSADFQQHHQATGWFSFRSVLFR